MGDFGEMESMVFSLAGLGCIFSHERDPGGFGAWIDFEDDRLKDRVFHCPVDETDGERITLVDACAATLQKQASAFLGTGHQRRFVFVEDEYRHDVLLLC